MNALSAFLRELILATVLGGLKPTLRESALPSLYGQGLRCRIEAGPDPSGLSVRSYVRLGSTHVLRTWRAAWATPMRERHGHTIRRQDVYRAQNEVGHTLTVETKR